MPEDAHYPQPPYENIKESSDEDKGVAILIIQ